jgi:hypothetical protein
MTPDAEAFVYYYDATVRSFGKRLRRTDRNAGRIPAVHAGQRYISDVDRRIDPGLYSAHVPEGGAVAGHIVLVKAGGHTGHATAAAGEIE